MKRTLFIVALATITAASAFAQADYFPIGPWAIAHTSDTINVKANWAGERHNLMDLGVTYIEGWTEPHDTLWMKNVCQPSNGQIKIFTSTVPNRPKESTFTNKIGNGGNSWSYPHNATLPPSWQDTLKTMLNTIASTYALNESWGGNLLSHELRGWWDADNWTVYYEATDFAALYWHRLIDSLGLPSYLADRSTNIMPLPDLVNSSIAEYASRMQNISIVENDCYVLGNTVPSVYAINSVEFQQFQNTLGWFVRSADSCFEHFEYPVPGKSSKVQWHSIFQTCRMDTNSYRNGQWVWDPALRWPTKEEIRVQAWLALSRGAKGIKYFLYFSSQPNLPINLNSEKFWGLVDEDRRPRDYNNPSPEGRGIYDWVKELNHAVAALSPTLVNLSCHYAFGVNHQPGVTPTLPAMTNSILKIKQVVAIDPVYHQRDFFEAGVFKDVSLTHYGDDYFMLVNRYCQPQDTVEVKVRLNYAPTYANADYFIIDVLNNETVSGLLPRSVDTSFTITLLPGGGRLLKIIPFKATVAVNGNTVYTNFRFVRLNTTVNTTCSVDSVQINQKYFSSVGDGLWNETTTGWLPYTNQSIQYLERSYSNQPNVFNVQYKIDGGKIVTPKVTAQIFFNDVAPEAGSLTISNGATYTNDTLVTVKVLGTDAFPGLHQMRFADSPFGYQEGYINYVNDVALNDSLAWTRRDDVHVENGYGFINHDRTIGVPGFEDYGTYIRQDLAMPDDGKLLRFSITLYGDVDQQPNVAVYAIDTTGGEPLIHFFINRTFTGPVFLFTGSSTLSDTFTYHLPDGFTVSRFVAFIGYPGLGGYFNVWPDEGQQGFFTRASSLPPGPSTVESHVYVDNIRLEPVDYVQTGNPPPPPDYLGGTIIDGWINSDVINQLPCTLSPGDGMKRVYLQLKDVAGNISAEPGWSDDIILDMTNPVVSIATPQNNSYVSGTVNIYGTPYDLNLQGWVLECKGQAEQTWQTLNSGTIGIPEGEKPALLGTWNTVAQNSSGSYLLRLTVTDLAGNVKADTHAVFVADGVSLPIEVITPQFITFSSLPVDGTTDSLGTIYVNDTKDNKVRVYSANGDSLYCFGSKSNNQDTTGFRKPQGIAVDDSGYLWVTDLNNDNVKKFANNGVFIKSFGEQGQDPGKFREPAGIAVDQHYVYVSDTKNDRVQKFTRAGGFIAQFGSTVLNNPTGIAIRFDQVDTAILEKVYVADSKHDRIMVFDTDGIVLDSIIGLGLDKPWDICFDRYNNLFIADVENNRIVELDPSHNQLLAFGQHGTGPGEFRKPQGLASSPDGKYLYVIDTRNDRVQRFQMVFDTLGGVNLSGGRRWTGPAAPQYVFSLGQNIPNPFGLVTEIKYQLPKQDQVLLNIYNISGQLVKTVVNEAQKAGVYSVKWDGKDRQNKAVASGVYLYRLQAGDQTDTRKIVLVR